MQIVKAVKVKTAKTLRVTVTRPTPQLAQKGVRLHLIRARRFMVFTKWICTRICRTTQLQPHLSCQVCPRRTSTLTHNGCLTITVQNIGSGSSTAVESGRALVYRGSGTRDATETGEMKTAHGGMQ